MPTRLAAAILLVLAFLGGAVVAASGAETPAPANDTRARLDAAETALKQIDSSLAKKDLQGNDLQALRAQIDPIGDFLGDLLTKLGPRLETLKARLEQFGPFPPTRRRPMPSPPPRWRDARSHRRPTTRPAPRFAVSGCWTTRLRIWRGSSAPSAATCSPVRFSNAHRACSVRPCGRSSSRSGRTTSAPCATS